MSNLPHPLDLEIQELTSYAIIIDARSPREYALDHLPGATNLPVVNNEEYAEVGTLHRTDKHGAYLIGVEYSLRNIANAINRVIRTIPRNDRVLVYCFRGGKRSRLWADNLKTIGYKVDVLPGGWKAYRRWVVNALETLPRAFDYRVLCGPTGCGKTRLLKALQQCGEQVLDLEGLARHRGSLIGSIPGESQPSQKLFDTTLVDAIRGFDPERPIWVEAESKKIGNIQLPASLLETMYASPFYRINAPMPERVTLWREDYSNLEKDPVQLMTWLSPLKELVGSDTLKQWQALADQGDMTTLFARLMTDHYDPAYLRSSGKKYPKFMQAPEINLASLSESELRAAAQELIRQR